MRIENQAGKAVADSSRTSAARSAGSEVTGQQSAAKSGTDQVSLSGASSLLALAKNVPSGKAEKIAALTSQFSSGKYQPDAAAISRSLVQSLKS